jgi:hypothetical protein
LEECQPKLLLQTGHGGILGKGGLKFFDGDGEIVIAQSFDAEIVVSLGGIGLKRKDGQREPNEYRRFHQNTSFNATWISRGA